MSRRRFFVDSISKGKAELSGEEARHLIDVLRAQTSQRFEVSDNHSVYLAEVVSTRKDWVQFAILEEVPPKPDELHLTVLLSLVKFDRFEWILEKGTELGVECFIPVVAERSDKGLAQGARKRLDRWHRVVRAASQQSRRDRMPEIATPVNFKDALASAASRRYFLDERERSRFVPGAAPDGVVALLTGPEGGWTDAERDAAVSAGWSPVSLGPRILRTETAAIAAIAVLAIAWQSQS